MKVRSKVKDFRAALQKDRKVDIWYKLNNKLTHIFTIVKLAKHNSKQKQFYRLTWMVDFEVLTKNKFIVIYEWNIRDLEGKVEISNELSDIMAYVNFAKAFWLEVKTIDTIPSIKKLIAGVQSDIPLDINVVRKDGKPEEAGEHSSPLKTWKASDLLPLASSVFKVLNLNATLLDAQRCDIVWEYMGIKIEFDTREVTWLNLGKVYIPKSRIFDVASYKTCQILDIARGFKNCKTWIESEIICWIHAINIYNEIHDMDANYKLREEKSFDYWDYPIANFNKASNPEQIDEFISELKDNIGIIEIREQLKELGYKKVIVGYYNNINLFTMDVETGDIKYSKAKSLDRACAHLKIYVHAQDMREYYINKPIDNKMRLCYQLNI